MKTKNRSHKQVANRLGAQRGTWRYQTKQMLGTTESYVGDSESPHCGCGSDAAFADEALERTRANAASFARRTGRVNPWGEDPLYNNNVGNPRSGQQCPMDEDLIPGSAMETCMPMTNRFTCQPNLYCTDAASNACLGAIVRATNATVTLHSS